MTGLGPRPLPQVSSLTEAFWDAAGRTVLVRPVCGNCGKNFFTPQIACPRCLSEDWTYEESNGRGQVYSSAIVHRPPFPGVEVPYEIATVDMDEGWSLLTNILDPGESPTAIGTPVEVSWTGIGEGINLPTFERSGAAAE